MRIETGYGARVFLTDAVSSVIIRESILPRFKAGDYGRRDHRRRRPDHQDDGTCRRRKRRKRAQEIGAAAKPARASGGINPFPVIFIVIIFFVDHRLDRPARRRPALSRQARRGGIDSGDLAVILWGLDALSRGSRGGGWGGGGWRRRRRRRRRFGGFSGGGGSFGGGGASGGW